MNPDNTFLGAYLKVDRAYAHIQNIKTNSQPLVPVAYKIEWIKPVGLPCMHGYAPISSDPDSKVMELAFLPQYPIPELFALMIGDTIHNLRTALDYAATAVVRAAGKCTSRVHFPFHEEREKLVAAETKGIRQIQAALPGADVEGFFQNTIKPYAAGNSDLWTINKADNVDKHNFILPAVTVSRIQSPMIVGRSGGMSFMSINSEMGHDAGHPFAFVRADTTHGFPENAGFQVSARISFPYGEFFGGKEAIPTLTNLAKLVIETLETFERFVVDAGLYPKMVRDS